MTKKNINIFEINDYLPGKNCKNCGENNCMAFAEKIAQGKKKMGGCAPLREEAYEKNRIIIEKMLNDKFED
jgi:ArsR family metal-binding transcriptional regulator